ncbi:MAG: hypothetical protein AAGH57_03590 [Pseudomonadota bacterium]
MQTPTIDIAAIPGLETAQGLFGSIKQSATSYDDGVVDVMVYVYDVLPPDALI